MLEMSFIGSPSGLMSYIGQEICEYCFGTGEVDSLESVYPGEAHQAYIGTERCICQLKSDLY